MQKIKYYNRIVNRFNKPMTVKEICEFSTNNKIQWQNLVEVRNCQLSHKGKDLEWWEGDILLFFDKDNPNDKSEHSKAMIVFIEGAFKLQYYENGKPYRHSEGDLFYQDIGTFEKEHAKVIGNIYQNKNLLK